MSDEPKLCDPDCPRKQSGTCYTHHGCRCEVCKRVNAERCSRRRKERDPSKLPPERHGKISTYSNWNCRCGECTEAWNTYQNKRYHTKPELREYYKQKSKQRYQAKKQGSDVEAV
jgi:hypothetical protein